MLRVTCSTGRSLDLVACAYALEAELWINAAAAISARRREAGHLSRCRSAPGTWLWSLPLGLARVDVFAELYRYLILMLATSSDDRGPRWLNHGGDRADVTRTSHH